MTEEDKLYEDRQQLQNLILSDGSIVLVLERSPPRRIHQAYCDGIPCLWAQSLDKSRAEIKDGFRIMVSSIQGQVKYYHVCCLEETLDLAPLAPHRFKLDTSCKGWNSDFPDTWGLLLRDWFKSSGQIDLGKFDACIERYLKLRAESHKDIAASETHSKGKGKNKAKANKKKNSEASDSNSSGVKAYQEPNLKDYHTTGKKTCTLSQVLQHQYVGLFQLWSPRQLEGLEDQMTD